MGRTKTTTKWYSERRHDTDDKRKDKVYDTSIKMERGERDTGN